MGSFIISLVRPSRSLVAGLLVLAGAASAGPADFRLTARRTALPVKVDGRLTEEAWRAAEVVGAFVQREPREGEPATERTEVRVLYDGAYLYFGFRCFDREPGLIVANEMRRDAELESNDRVEVFLDSYHDSRNAFYFATNPLGARFDSLIRDEGGAVSKDWDGIWLCAARTDEEGWTAEIAVPFYALRFGSDRVQTWGVNFGRRIARKKEEVFWTPVLRDYGFFGQYRVSFYGHLDGLEDLRQGKRLQVMPYALAGGEKPDRYDPFGAKVEAGLDLKYRLTSNITGDLTVNTDFAQVEADQEQFNLTRFDLFFPEKREFFLEGGDIFRFGERFQEHEPPSTLLFFSRTVGLHEGQGVPILGGVKVTGKAGRWDLGVMDMVTDRMSYRDEESSWSLARTNYGVFRLKRDIFEKSSVGVMALSKDPLSGEEGSNRAGGLDFSLAFGPNFQGGGFLAKSSTPGLKDRDGAGYLNLFWNSDLVSADLSYTDIGENFNSEMGFVPRTDIRKLRANFGISPRPKFLGLRQVFLMDNFTYIENHGGRIESRNNMVGAFSLFQNGTVLFLGAIQNYEFLSESFEIKDGVEIPRGVHRYDLGMLMFNSDRSRPVSFEAMVEAGEFYNGNLLGMRVQGNVKVSSRLSLELLFDRNAFDLPVPGGNFVTNIAGSRAIYAFTPDLYAKVFVQWNDAESLFKSNFLIRWIYKPGANIYFIYNETRKLGAGGYLKDRAVMLKASFLFNT